MSGQNLAWTIRVAAHLLDRLGSLTRILESWYKYSGRVVGLLVSATYIVWLRRYLLGSVEAMATDLICCAVVDVSFRRTSLKCSVSS